MKSIIGTHQLRTGASIFVALAWMLGFSAVGVAQVGKPLDELNIEELLKVDVQSVFGASKFLQNVTDAPAAVSIVTRQDIERSGYRTLADILANSHGFNVTDDRNYSFIGVRGFQRSGDYNTRILVLVDGHRANDSIYDMAAIGTEFPLDLALVERVEVIRGPSSSLYGTNAFFAVVNIVMRKGRDLHGLQVSGSGGTLHSASDRITFGNSFRNGLDVQLSGSFYHSNGQSRIYFPEFDTPSTNNGIAENADKDTNRQVFGSASFKGLSFQGVYGVREKHVPTAAFDSIFNDTRLRVSDSRGWLDLRYTHDFARDVQITARTYYDYYYYEGHYPQVDYLSLDSGTEKSWGAEIDVQKVLMKTHRITAGSEFRDNLRLSQSSVNADTSEEYFSNSHSSSVSAVFVEDQFTIHEKLLLNAGIRHDRYPGFGGTTNPRLALIYKPLPKTAVKFLWGTAFRAPNSYELFYTDTLLDSNPALTPETIHTSEVVVEHYFKQSYRAMVSVYRNRVKDLINESPAPNGKLQFQNLDSARTIGFEGELEGKWRLGLAARFSYSFQHAVDGSSGLPLSNSAKHLATGSFTIPLFRRTLFANANVHAVGPVQTLDGSFTKAFAVSDITATTRKLAGGFNLYGSVRNILNNHYGYPASVEHRVNIIYQNGRTFQGGLKYTFDMARN